MKFNRSTLVVLDHDARVIDRLVEGIVQGPGIYRQYTRMCSCFLAENPSERPPANADTRALEAWADTRWEVFARDAGLI